MSSKLPGWVNVGAVISSALIGGLIGALPIQQSRMIAGLVGGGAIGSLFIFSADRKQIIDRYARDVADNRELVIAADEKLSRLLDLEQQSDALISKDKLDKALEHLFTNQKGLVTLNQLVAFSGQSADVCAAYLTERLKNLKFQVVGENAFVIDGHPEPLLQAIEANVIERFKAQMAAQPTPEQLYAQQAAIQQEQTRQAWAAANVPPIQQEQARQAWAAANVPPQQLQPPVVMPQQPMMTPAEMTDANPWQGLI